eukprot:2299824-Amphidinium_carterae.2
MARVIHCIATSACGRARLVKLTEVFSSTRQSSPLLDVSHGASRSMARLLVPMCTWRIVSFFILLFLHQLGKMKFDAFTVWQVCTRSTVSPVTLLAWSLIAWKPTCFTMSCARKTKTMASKRLPLEGLIPVTDSTVILMVFLIPLFVNMDALTDTMDKFVTRLLIVLTIAQHQFNRQGNACFAYRLWHLPPALWTNLAHSIMSVLDAVFLESCFRFLVSHLGAITLRHWWHIWCRDRVSPCSQTIDEEFGSLYDGLFRKLHGAPPGAPPASCAAWGSTSCHRREAYASFVTGLM